MIIEFNEATNRDTEGWYLDMVYSAENVPTVNGFQQLKYVLTSEVATALLDHVLAEDNLNLSDDQKELLLCHCRLGHIGFQWL